MILMVPCLLMTLASATGLNIWPTLNVNFNCASTGSLGTGLNVSISKTQCMHFCQMRKMHNDPDLNLNGTPIKVVKEYKYLGLIFDSRLSFNL